MNVEREVPERRRTLASILADAVPVLRRSGASALAEEVDRWRSRTAGAHRLFENYLLFGFLLAVSAGIGAAGIRSGAWEWTVGAVVFAVFVVTAIARLAAGLKDD